MPVIYTTLYFILSKAVAGYAKKMEKDRNNIMAVAFLYLSEIMVYL